MVRKEKSRCINFLPVTDTNGVICKIIVGAGANDSPFVGLRKMSLRGVEGAAPYKCEKEKDI